MKKLVFAVLAVVCLTMAACAELETNEIPAPFKTKIANLRADSVAMQHKCADLQREIMTMQAQQNWDQQQINVVAGEALFAAGKSPAEWRVDVDKMKLVPLHK